MSKLKQYQKRSCGECFNRLRCPVPLTDWETASVCALFRYAALNGVYKDLKKSIRKSHDAHKDQIELTLDTKSARLLRDLLKGYLGTGGIFL